MDEIRPEQLLDHPVMAAEQADAVGRRKLPVEIGPERTGQPIIRRIRQAMARAEGVKEPAPTDRFEGRCSRSDQENIRMT